MTRIPRGVDAVAVLGDNVPANAAVPLAGLDPDDRERAADALAATGILGPRRHLRFDIKSLERDARDELRIAGAHPQREQPAGPDALTPADRRVADAASAGWSNREIAERPFLSGKTVEMHFVYRKLENTARGEPADALSCSLALAA